MVTDFKTEKEKIFEEIYHQKLTENGFQRKKKWQYYRIFDSKYILFVNLYSSSYNSSSEATFSIALNIYFNPTKEKIKISKLENPLENSVSFSLLDLIYPEDNCKTEREFRYYLGGDYKPMPKYTEYNSSFYGAKEGNSKTQISKIDENFLEHKITETNKKGEITKSSQFIIRDTTNRYDTQNIVQIRNVITNDLLKIIAFAKELEDINALIIMNESKPILTKKIIEEINKKNSN